MSSHCSSDEFAQRRENKSKLILSVHRCTLKQGCTDDY